MVTGGSTIFGDSPGENPLQRTSLKVL